MNISIEPKRFFRTFKKKSENFWETIEIDPTLYGFQIHQNTKWLPGLAKNEIASYEKELGFKFPEIYKEFLSCMNGTDKSSVNIYGESGEEYQYAPGYYSFPKDLEVVEEQIGWIYEACEITKEEVEEKQLPHIIPIVGHRCLIADRCDTYPVLSMYGRDIILYASNLQNFLVNDVFHKHALGENLSDIKVKFWLEQ
ncbi:MAG: SMI1/KNR4 family protein [Trueperaceae bacterium]